jgi:hypothetical protein
MLTSFMATEVTPIVEDLAAVGTDAGEIFRAVAKLLHAAADGIEGELEHGQT